MEKSRGVPHALVALAVVLFTIASGTPMAAALTAPEVVERGMISHVEHPTAGSLPLVNSPINLSAAPDTAPTPPPLLGEHT